MYRTEFDFRIYIKIYNYLIIAAIIECHNSHSVSTVRDNYMYFWLGYGLDKLKQF